MYLTHEEWTRMGGDALDAHLFARMELKARKLIDRVTRGRIAHESPVREAVKYCAFDLIGAMVSDESTLGSSGREIASMSNDGVSVTYATATGASGSVSARYAQIARAWLSDETTACGTPLLYAGVDA